MTASDSTRASAEKVSGRAQTEAQLLEALEADQSITIARLRSRLDCSEVQLRAALADLQSRDRIAVQTGIYCVRIVLTEGDT